MAFLNIIGSPHFGQVIIVEFIDFSSMQSISSFFDLVKTNEYAINKTAGKNIVQAVATNFSVALYLLYQPCVVLPCHDASLTLLFKIEKTPKYNMLPVVKKEIVF